jgi:hypothetical protein
MCRRGGSTLAKTKTCRACREEIHRKATVCPHCRSKQRRGAGLGLVLSFTLVGAFSVLSLNPPPATRPAKVPNTSSVASERNLNRATPAAFVAEETIVIPSDTKARYFPLERGGTATDPTLVTKRVGPSGTSFSQRLFDCRAGTFKYLGDGATLAEMRNSQPNANMTALVDGSIADYLWRHACEK